jgi:ABC-type taurine transport system ATPase subunit
MAKLRNVKSEVKGTKLLIEVDLSVDLGPSESGKTNLIASSGGFNDLEDGSGRKFNLMVTSPKRKQ